MKSFRILGLIFLINTAFFAQTKRVVKDSLTQEVIPFASIFIEKSKQSFTADENGIFQLSNHDNEGKISFSAVGYQKKTIEIKNILAILLKPIAYELEEVVVANDVKTKTLEIGLTKDKYLQAFENGAKYEVKFFPYLPIYKKTNFIKTVTFHTESKLDKASFKIHFYAVNDNGLPGKELLDRDCIVSVKLGTRKTSFNISYLNLEMPTKGIFVAFEKLTLESNKFEKKDPNGTLLQKSYQPNIYYNSVEKIAQFKYYDGKWNQKKNDDNSTLIFNEPAIYLTLTN